MGDKCQCFKFYFRTSIDIKKGKNNVMLSDKVIQRLNSYLIQDKNLIRVEVKEHSERVEKYSLLIFDNLLPEDIEAIKKKGVTRELVGICGRFHDIGKCFISEYYPDVLCTKFFGGFEREVMKQHTLMGSQLLLQAMLEENEPTTNNHDFKCLFETCLYHHENLDGTGYYGRSKIPRIAQLVAVADRFTAGIEKRLYHEPKAPSLVISELQIQDNQLNQSYVEALIRGINGSTTE